VSSAKPILQILIRVNVVIVNNQAQYVASYANSGKPIKKNDVIKAPPGTLIGWVVLVFPGPQPRPYQITFGDSSVFGVSSLDVPNGGISPWLQVLALTGQTKFTLSVPPLTPAFDPEIQVGADTAILGAKADAPKFRVSWDVDSGSALLLNGDPFPPAGVNAKRGDGFTFVATQGGSSVDYLGTCQVGGASNWNSPFDQFNSTFSGTDPLTVGDVTGSVTSFPFNLSVLDLGKTSNEYVINVVSGNGP
jgi:hypothetical protein